MGKYARAARRDMKRKLGGGKVREAVLDKALDIEREAQRLQARNVIDQTANDLVTIFFDVVHREGFGKARIQRLHQRMADTLQCIKEGYVTVAEIRENLAQEIGYDPIGGKDVPRGKVEKSA